MTYARRKDANHDEIRDALRKAGCTVFDSYQLGRGFPDIVVMRDGFVRFLEVKSGNSPLTAPEYAFLRVWKDVTSVVHSVDEAFEAMGIVTE